LNRRASGGWRVWAAARQAAFGVQSERIVTSKALLAKSVIGQFGLPITLLAELIYGRGMAFPAAINPKYFQTKILGGIMDNVKQTAAPSASLCSYKIDLTLS
jgi:hypothetical protein